MNWKKISFILIVFLTFLGTGIMLSNVQSREADQLLEAHGMGNGTRYFYTNNSEKISDFLHYLNQNYPKVRLQIHFDNQQNQDQVLVWANHSLQKLPTQSGRYFAPDDFKGSISFAVLGPDSKNNVIERQGNRYVHVGQNYYSVIGEFKNYHQSEQKKYYLTTGINQSTADCPLSNYRIVIDCSNKNVLREIAKKYQASLKTPSFVKRHQIYRFSVIREILLILLFWVIAMLANGLIATMEWRQVQLSHLKGSLYRNWLINRGLRLILIESLLEVIAYAFLRWRAFFSKPNHLIELLILNWLVAISAYLIVWLFLKWKEKKNA